jgi:hypothetical protein
MISKKVDFMKNALKKMLLKGILLISVFNGSSLQAFNDLLDNMSDLKFRGNVEIKRNKDIFVQDEVSRSRVQLFVSDNEIQKTILKLKSGDMISGSGHLQDQNLNGITVDSVAFVGIANLVGYWTHNTKLFNFLNFSALSIWTMDGGPVPTSEIYKYVLTPTQGNGWRIFVGGEPDGVNVGSLEIKGTQAHIVLHDPKSHKIIADYTLEKIE